MGPFFYWHRHTHTRNEQTNLPTTEACACHERENALKGVGPDDTILSILLPCCFSKEISSFSPSNDGGNTFNYRLDWCGGIDGSWPSGTYFSIYFFLFFFFTSSSPRNSNRIVNVFLPLFIIVNRLVCVCGCGGWLVRGFFLSHTHKSAQTCSSLGSKGVNKPPPQVLSI